MKKATRIRTLAEIRQQCVAQGVPLNAHLYLTQGWDTVVVGHEWNTQLQPGHAIYNTFSGEFWGVTPDGVPFNSRCPGNDHEVWFQDLLHFFYVYPQGLTEPFPAKVKPARIGAYLVTGWTANLRESTTGLAVQATLRYWDGKGWVWHYGGRWHKDDIEGCTWQGLTAPQI